MNSQHATYPKAKLSLSTAKMRKSSSKTNAKKKPNNSTWKWKKSTRPSACTATPTSGTTWSAWRNSSDLTCSRICRSKSHPSSRRTATTSKPNSATSTVACGWTHARCTRLTNSGTRHCACARPMAVARRSTSLPKDGQSLWVRIKGLNCSWSWVWTSQPLTNWWT